MTPLRVCAALDGYRIGFDLGPGPEGFEPLPGSYPNRHEASLAWAAAVALQEQADALLSGVLGHARATGGEA